MAAAASASAGAGAVAAEQLMGSRMQTPGTTRMGRARGASETLSPDGPGMEKSMASSGPSAGDHLQPLKEAPPEKMPSVASCRCSPELEKRHLDDWRGSGAYVFIGLTLPCPRRKGWLQEWGRVRVVPKVSAFQDGSQIPFKNHSLSSFGRDKSPLADLDVDPPTFFASTSLSSG